MKGSQWSQSFNQWPIANKSANFARIQMEHRDQHHSALSVGRTFNAPESKHPVSQSTSAFRQKVVFNLSCSSKKPDDFAS